jgi:hypothetical protein
MTAPMPVDAELGDLKDRIHQMNLGRRRLAHSVNATGISLHRVLDAGNRTRNEEWENWPRPTKRRAHSYRRIAVLLLFLLLVVVLLGAIIQRRGPGVQASPVVAAPAAPSQPVAVVAHTLMTDPFVIHVRATGPSRVRVTVDGAALDWRALQEGDEFLVRPHQEMFIQATDGGALTARVNGKPISLGPDGQAVAVRLTSKGLFREPVSLP